MRTGFVLAAVAFGGMFADSLVKLAMAASDPGVCAVFWGGAPAGQVKEMTFQEESCDGNGHLVSGRSGKCFYNANTGNCKCYLPDLVTETPAPNGWTCDLQIASCVGNCCNGCPTTSCTGTCTYQPVDDFSGSYPYQSVGGTCPTSGPCACPNVPTSGGAPVVATQAVYNTGVAARITTGCDGVVHPSGPCDGHGGNADGDACCADVDCDDHDASKCAPEQCNPPPPICQGNCTYTSVQQGEPGNYVWELTDASCTAGAPNCGCPSGPGGNCPTSGGLHTSVACGASGGPCTPTACTGSCNYKAISIGNGKFAWTPNGNNCAVGPSNCGCPSEPGGECPINADQTKSVACGSPSVACTQPKCADHGGDADKDGCCKDKDVDDEDSSVCEATCKGTYTRCQRCRKRNPEDQAGPEIPCDPDTGTDEEKAACRCTACTSSGSQSDDCRCSNVTNGDKDKDGCCDNVDKYPTDPAKGCECCDWQDTWDTSGGAELRTQWGRIVGAVDGSQPSAYGPVRYSINGGSQRTFITYNSSTKSWDMTTPSGEPSPISFSVPWSMILGTSAPTTTVVVPVTVSQLQGILNGAGLTTSAGMLSAFDTYRQWFRLAMAWAVAVYLFSVVFQEFRV